MRMLWSAAAIATLLSAPAGAEEPRPLRVRAQAGGALAVTGPGGLDAQATAAISPGGALGRYGLRLSARSFDAADGLAEDGFLAAGVSYEAAASRPRLVISLFAEAGIASGWVPVAGGGVHTDLYVFGPLALGGEIAAHLFVDGSDTALGVSGSLLAGLGF